MSDYCKKCGSEINSPDTMCMKCNEPHSPTVIKDKRKIIRQSLALSIGSISLFFFIQNIGTFQFSLSRPPSLTNFFVYSIGYIFIVIAGILLILSYYQSLYSKQYEKIFGIIGCIILIVALMYFFLDFTDNNPAFFMYMFLYFLPFVVWLFATIFLLICFVISGKNKE